MSHLHWSERPFSLLSTPTKTDDVAESFYKSAVDMALIHNIFIRALNSIYNHAPLVSRSGTTKDKTDFLTFVRAWHETIHAHHTGEELFYFPALEAASGSPGLMSTNVAQHEAFHAGLDALHTYALNSLAAPSTFDSTELLGIIDSFAPALTAHLHDEIPTLIEMGRRFPSVDATKIDEEHAQKMLATVNKLIFVPLFLSNHDNEFEGGKWKGVFPPTPRIVTVLTKWALYWPYRGAWRFSACTFDQELKKEMLF
ncbi:hypothetical protein EXIGLDRAFT_769937 [Exidia glandulosa HHB12029]|uniref:Hemerythrin-like domain-containing protein n=1 Tax=Exidia glandulosa HHB12029 TaxID=1314781 RepID=A0A166AFF1_EXIGL|nr:hypothetical protein EXIGLDRAFT_769937 [Exidia glandulosa HHB12029]